MASDAGPQQGHEQANSTRKTHYDVLGVPRDATDVQIRSAYRKRAKATHPDINKNKVAEFRSIAEAYEILSDADKKKSYDDTLRSGSSSAPHATHTPPRPNATPRPSAAHSTQKPRPQPNYTPPRTASPPPPSQYTPSPKYSPPIAFNGLNAEQAFYEKKLSEARKSNNKEDIARYSKIVEKYKTASTTK